MSYFQAIVLGFVQGMAEFLPISSSGHLVLVNKILGGEANLPFNVLLHIGTLVSALFVFGKDMVGVIAAFFKMCGEFFTQKGKVDLEKSEYRRLAILLIIATIPLIIGAACESFVEGIQPWLVGIFLITTGVILLWTAKLPIGKKDERSTKFSDGLWVGISQLFAIVPGLSRSGTTIFAGRLRGLSPQFAVKFSFLLSSVAILGAAVIEFGDLMEQTITFGPAIAGVITAAVVGVFAIKWLVNLVNKGKYSFLAYYCFAVGLIAIFVR